DRCPKCAAPVEAKWLRCPACGTALPGAHAAPTGVQATRPTARPALPSAPDDEWEFQRRPQAPRPRLRVLSLIGSIALIIFGLFGIGLAVDVAGHGNTAIALMIFAVCALFVGIGAYGFIVEVMPRRAGAGVDASEQRVARRLVRGTLLLIAVLALSCV